MNGSSSNNQTEEYVVPYSVEMKIGYSMAYLAILLVAVSGNSFVIHVARKLLSAGRGPFNILVINMAASDILYAFTVVSLNLKYLYNGNLWFPGEFGAFLCKFSGFALVFSISYSILSLIAMTVDRYLAIVPDVKKPLTRKTVLKVIFAVLVSSFGWSSFNFFKLDTASDVYPEEKLTFCYFVYSGDKYVDEKLLKVEYTLSFIFLYVFPVAVMSVLYFFIIRFLWLREIPGNRTNQNEAKRRKHFKKVTCMLVIMATTFTVTWFPAHFVHYYWAYDNICRLPSFLPSFLFWSAHTNCATNPCFYVIFNKEYRDELRRLFVVAVNSQGQNRVQNNNLQWVKAGYRSVILGYRGQCSVSTVHP